MPRSYPKIRNEIEFLDKLKEIANKFRDLPNNEVPVSNLDSRQQTSKKVESAEAIWSQVLQVDDEAERIWTDTQDVVDYGLDGYFYVLFKSLAFAEDWNFQPRQEEEEDDNLDEMTMLVEEAGLHEQVSFTFCL